MSDDKKIDVTDHDNKDEELKDSTKVQMSQKRKKIFLYGAIGIVLVVIISMTHSNKTANIQNKQQDQLEGHIDPRLLAMSNARFAALNKKNIEYLNVPPQPVKPQTAPVEKDNSKLDNLMKAPLRPDIRDNTKISHTSTATKALQDSITNEGYGQFANDQPSTVTTISATKLKATDYMIVQGEFLHAVLDTAISSEIQGNVTATLTKPAYSYTGKNILIPVGSRLIGSYAMSNHGNGMAATRIFIIWNRIITPSGISIMINSAGSDNLGMTGTQADVVDRHFFLIFGSSTLLSIIGAGIANSTNGSQNNGQSSQQGYFSSIQNSFSNTANTMLSKFTSIQTTLYANQGKQITIFLNKDLNLYGAYH